MLVMNGYMKNINTFKEWEFGGKPKATLHGIMSVQVLEAVEDENDAGLTIPYDIAIHAKDEVALQLQEAGQEEITFIAEPFATEEDAEVFGLKVLLIDQDNTLTQQLQDMLLDKIAKA